MQQKALVIRYPNGDFEYGFSGQAPPAIGDTVTRKGENWRVTRLVGNGVVTAYVERVGRTHHSAHPKPL